VLRLHPWLPLGWAKNHYKMLHLIREFIIFYVAEMKIATKFNRDVLHQARSYRDSNMSANFQLPRFAKNNQMGETLKKDLFRT
jgi:hypothetical protein